MTLGAGKIKRRFLMIFMPMIFIGFFYSVSTKKNVGPTNSQLALMQKEMQWIKRSGVHDIVTYAEGEVSKSGLADLYVIIDPTYWQQPSRKLLEENGWALHSEKAYCKYGVMLVFSPSWYRDKNAVSIRMTYDEKTVGRCGESRKL